MSDAEKIVNAILALKESIDNLNETLQTNGKTQIEISDEQTENSKVVNRTLERIENRISQLSWKNDR